MSTSPEGHIDIQIVGRGDGVGRVEVRSSRPLLAQKLMAGRLPEEGAVLAGLLFSLCGRAQKVAARSAAEAAMGIELRPEILRGRVLEVCRELAQEHAWRLLLNWPQQAGREPDMASLLVLRQAATEPTGFAASLENLLGAVTLGESPDLWLARDLAAFDAWRRDGRTETARLFAGLGDGPDVGVGRCVLLPPLSEMDDTLARTLAESALNNPAFCAAPLWRDAPAETGAVARTAAHPLLAGWIVRRGRGAGARLLARLLELAEMPQWLRASDNASVARMVRAWSLGDNIGVAGVETSRGLLMHVVRLEAGRIADYRILAPTEWNSGPAGPLVQALESLPAGPGLASRARLVAQSLDPCVEYGVELLEQ